MLSLIPGIKIFPSEANYVLCKFDGGDMDLGVSTAEELSIRLQLAGLLVPQLSRTTGLEDEESYFCIAAQRRDTFASNVKTRLGTAFLSARGASVRQAFPPSPQFRSFFSQILSQYSIICAFPNLTIFFLLF
jgi:hypothetical protein